MNSIYIGNIGSLYESPALYVRRNIMKSLLIWDTITLSDSQLLTDPRLHYLMNRDALSEKESISIETIYPWLEGVGGEFKLTDHQRGLEELFSAGIIQVAYRSNGGQRDNMCTVWDKMKHYDADVPHFPLDRGYAEYLDNISISGTRSYDLPAISGMFQKKLAVGIENESIHLSESRTGEGTLKEMFFQPGINFSTILEQLNTMYPEQDMSNRYRLLKTYVNSCYSCNIPDLLGCFHTELTEKLPWHLGFGRGDFLDAPPEMDLEKLRPTWIWIDALLDFIPFHMFIDIRNDLRDTRQHGRFASLIRGTLTKEQLKDFYDAWEDFTRKVEHEMGKYLKIWAYEIYRELEKTGGLQLVQNTVFGESTEIVKTLVLPILSSLSGPIGGIAGLLSSTQGYIDSANARINYLSNAPTWRSLEERKDAVTKLIDDRNTGRSMCITEYLPMDEYT